MRNAVKLFAYCAFFVSLISACTFGDKGREGRTDSAVVDTTVHSSPAAGHQGTGINQDTPVHSKENSIVKDTMGTDTTGRPKKP